MKTNDMPIVLCLRLETGDFGPLAWSNDKISKKAARRATRKFQKDYDVIGYATLPWNRLYDTLSDMKSELPEL
jgi:hypothetical protein